MRSPDPMDRSVLLAYNFDSNDGGVFSNSGLCGKACDLRAGALFNRDMYIDTGSGVARFVTPPGEVRSGIPTISFSNALF